MTNEYISLYERVNINNVTKKIDLIKKYININSSNNIKVFLDYENKKNKYHDFKFLIEELKNKKISKVIIHDFTSIPRKTGDYVDFLYELGDCKVYNFQDEEMIEFSLNPFRNLISNLDM